MAKKKTFENVISNLLGEPVSNLCHAFYDQYVEANVKFRSRAGMKEVIIRRQLGKCCKWCADLAGIYLADSAPKDIYRRHDNCRCMVTYKDEDGYTDAWSKKTFGTQRDVRRARELELTKKPFDTQRKAREARERELMEMILNGNNKKYVERQYPLFLRNNLPHGYKDNRTIGFPISEKRLQEIKERAAAKSVKLGTQNGNTGNFELYCGRPEVLEELIDRLGDNILWAKEKGFIKETEQLILYYDNVLGYEGKKGVIDIGAFAEVKGKTITLNKFMFDDSDFLMLQYKDAVDRRFFANGTSYKSIVDHEFGHILKKRCKSLQNRAITALQKDADDAKINIEDFIVERISKYAAYQVSEGYYGELIPELFSMSKGTESSYAREILERVL